MTDEKNRQRSQAIPTGVERDAQIQRSVEQAISQAVANGHRMTQAFDNGTEMLMAQCRTCGMLALGALTMMGGQAVTERCTGVKPTQPTMQAPPKTTTKQAPKQVPNLTSPGGIDSPTRICDVCGSGTTLVGVSCRKCGNSRNLTERAKPKAPKPAYEIDSKGNPDAAARTLFIDGQYWNRASSKRPKPDPITNERQFLTAPCGAKHSVAATYVPSTWDADGDDRPDILIAYPCHKECIEVVKSRKK